MLLLAPKAGEAVRSWAGKTIPRGWPYWKDSLLGLQADFGISLRFLWFSNGERIAFVILPLAGAFLLFQQQGPALPIQHGMLLHQGRNLNAESSPCPVLRDYFCSELLVLAVSLNKKKLVPNLCLRPSVPSRAPPSPRNSKGPGMRGQSPSRGG